MAQETIKKYDDEKRGVLFRNENPRSEKSPSYTGHIKIDGRWWRLAGWTQKSRAGDTYLSLSASVPTDEQLAKLEEKSTIPF